MSNQVPSPCETCTRLPYPDRCDNKRCVPWQNWMLGRWALIHQKYLQLCKERSKQNELEK